MASNPGRKESKKASPAKIAKVLKGIDFPKKKKEIVDYAKGHTPEDNPDIVFILSLLPEREYDSMADVERGVGQVE